MDLLVDALTAWDLVIGLPLPIAAADRGEVHSYFISYPEYLFLLDVACDVAEPTWEATPLAEMSAALESIFTVADWIAEYLDLNRLSETERVPLELAVPGANLARHVPAIRRYYRLDDREATNLLVAEERNIPFVAQASSLSDAFRHAAQDRDLTLLLAA